MQKVTSKGTVLPLLKLKGKEYLEVKWRLVWMREEHPDWTINTEIVSHTDDLSIVKAQILHADLLIASAHKREDKKHFMDHLEKAETGAIGRALAMCGYGTQFDGGDLEEGERLADAPVKMPNESKVAEVSTDQKVAMINARLKQLTNGFTETDKLKFLYGEISIKENADLKKKKHDELDAILRMLG